MNEIITLIIAGIDLFIAGMIVGKLMFGEKHRMSIEEYNKSDTPEKIKGQTQFIEPTSPKETIDDILKQ